MNIFLYQPLRKAPYKLPLLMSKVKIDIEALYKEFQTIQVHTQAFSSELTRQIATLIEKEGIRLAFPIQNRAKTWESITDKTNSGRFKPKSSILEMQDLVGIRIILLFKSDTERIADVVRKNFKVINEYNTEDRLDENEFGYLSIHQVIELTDEWTSVPTLKDFKGIMAEIQIRTLAQHSWAEASNIFQYKNEENVPKPLKRTINRISALLETVDLEFERILQERNDYIEEIKDIKLNEKSTQFLNVELLKKIMDDKLPSKNKGNSEDYSELIDNLKVAGIEDSGSFISLIDKYLKETLTTDKKVAHGIMSAFEKNKSLDSGLGYMAISSDELDRIRTGVFLSHTGIIRHIIKLHTGKDWWELKNHN